MIEHGNLEGRKCYKVWQIKFASNIRSISNISKEANVAYENKLYILYSFVQEIKMNKH